MKFGTLLELNSNIEWWEHYVDYDALKKLFPSVPLDPDYLATQQHAESGALLPTHRVESAKWASPEQFRAALEHERDKVANFYKGKIADLHSQYEALDREASLAEDTQLDVLGDEDVIREEDEDGDVDGDGAGGNGEGDTLLPHHYRRPSVSPTRRYRPSIIDRWTPRLLRTKSQASTPDVQDIFDSSVRRVRSRSAQPEPTTPGTAITGLEDSGTLSAGRGRVPPPRRNRRTSDLESSADEAPGYFERRASMSSQSSGGGGGGMGTYSRKLPFRQNFDPVEMEPSRIPGWAADPFLSPEYDGAAASTGAGAGTIATMATVGTAKRPVYYWRILGGGSDYVYIRLKRHISTLWLEAYSLKQYVDLNMTAFEKILKKYDKNTNSKLKKSFIAEQVKTSPPWREEDTQDLDQLLARVLFMYRRIACEGDEDAAKEQLRAQLREKVVVDRETVWSQMVSGRRGAQGIFRSVEPDEHVSAFEPSSRAVRTPLGVFVRPQWLSMKAVILLVALATMIAIVQVQPFDRVEESNCLAMLVFCTILWATEALPLFVTSLAVPFLVVFLRVLRSSDDDDRRLTAAEGTKYIFSQMFSPTIMLLIGGFTIAAVLSKTRLDVMTASRILNAAGQHPSVVLLVLMFVATFASMWISNVAAPTLCYALIKPITDELQPKSVFSRCLIIAIALASNIGGQASPISSPQNLIAVIAMDPAISWLEWFAISLPVAGTSIIVIWAFLHINYRWESDLLIPKMRKNTDSLTMTHYYVLLVTLVTIGLWCAEKSMESWIGDMGIIAIIPLIAFFGTGILSKEDFHSFHWSIVFLAMGGIALGKAVLSSGLLDDLDHVLESAVEGMGLYSILTIFSLIALVIATFISHTIAAVLLVPIATRIGDSMDEPHPRLLIMVTALICSAGMGLPVSGFPNMTAITQENKLGHRFIGAGDFLKNGIPASVLATFVIGTIGYAIMRWLGL